MVGTMHSYLLLVLLLSSSLAVTDAWSSDAEKDKVTELPMSDKLKNRNFGFSGYIDVDGAEKDSKHMHYWFFPSESGQDTDPVVFWTNGGPGCSGLLGAMTEQGPFWPQKDGYLADNNFAWNKKANMIFVEQPCGVGFSYSSANDTKADYTYDDDMAAKDFFGLIEGWLGRFPELSKNDLYLTSESYGGHYFTDIGQIHCRSRRRWKYGLKWQLQGLHGWQSCHRRVFHNSGYDRHVVWTPTYP